MSSPTKNSITSEKKKPIRKALVKRTSNSLFCFLTVSRSGAISK